MIVSQHDQAVITSNPSECWSHTLGALRHEAFLMVPDLQLSARPHHYQNAPQNLIDVRKDQA